MLDQNPGTTPAIAAPSPWARNLLLVGLGLMPIFVIPVAGFPFALAKIVLFGIFAAACTVVLGFSSLKRGAVNLPVSKISYAVAGLLAAYGAATLLSQDWRLSVAGSGTETDTFLFIGMATLAFLLASAVFSTRSAALRLFTVLMASAVVAALFQVVRLFWGSLFSSSVFTSVSSNLVGTWNDFGIIMGVLAVLCAAHVDTKAMRGPARLALIAGLVLSLVLLAFVNFAAIWWALLASAAAIAYATLARHISNDGMQSQGGIRIPFASVAVALVAAVFLIFGPTLSAKLQPLVKIQEVEAQLTLPTTLEVTRTTYAQSALTTFFGSGPATFGQQWLLYKPASLTSSDFWQLDFGGGFSTIATAFLSVGLVGGILFLLIPILALVMIIRAARRPLSEEYGVFTIAVALSVFLWTIICLYAPGQTVITLAFAALGVLVGTSSLSRESTVRLLGRGRNQLLLVLVVLLSIGGASALAQRFIASVYQGKALLSASANDMASAERLAQRSLSLYRSEDTLRLLASIKFANAQTIAAETDKATESTRANRLKDALSQASGYANAAVQSYPTHWRNWLTAAQFYESLIPLKVDGAYQQAETAYTNAIRLSPRNPELYLMLARMEATAGNEQNARAAVGQALTLKPNYTDAILLIVQIEVAKNNIDGAINAAAAAVQTSPANAGLWFELGALAYTKGDDANATAALQQAVKLAPDYANAKYFLGLSLYRSGKVGDGVAIFEELAKQNPDNQEVATILADMKSGKSAPKPAPTTAPVKEN
jgi:cytochrome c-type biogenesis protein CcmH/NrfG